MTSDSELIRLARQTYATADTVRALASRVDAVGASTMWRGPAASAFRERLDDRHREVRALADQVSTLAGQLATLATLVGSMQSETGAP